MKLLKHLFFWIVVLFSLELVLFCTEPDEITVNPHEQQQVDWPSLDDSPAPMYHGGPLGNGLSFEEGPLSGAVQWFVEFPGVGHGIVVDENNHIYTTGNDGILICINQGGTVEWQLQLLDEPARTTPIVLNDGNLAVFLKNKYFIISRDGEIILEKELPGIVDALSVRIDKLGDYYLGFRNENTLHKYSRQGDHIWSLSPPDSLQDTFDLNFYIPVFVSSGNELIVRGIKNLYSISIAGEIKWIKEVEVWAPPLTDNSGNIYYYSGRDSMIVCIDSTGNTIWDTFVDNFKPSGFSRGAITIHGDIVFPSTGLDLMSLSPRGDISWQIQLPDNGLPGNGIKSELISDKNGVVYASSWGSGLYAFSNTGSLLWEVTGNYFVGMSPAISENILYFGHSDIDGGIFAIH